MKEFFKTHRKRIVILACDALCVLAALICGPLSQALLQHTDQVCIWNAMGGQCLTCGGTHFVNDLLSFRIGAAFMDNQLLFVMTLYLLVSLIFLNLYLLFDLAFAKRVLKWMYNIPVLIVFCSFMLVFFIVRNVPMFLNFAQILTDLLEKL